MLHVSAFYLFRMSLGSMLVDYKVMSRDHKRSLRVEDAVVDPLLETTCLPLSWIEQLRSPSRRLPTGYYVEELINITHPYINTNKNESNIANKSLVNEKQNVASSTTRSPQNSFPQNHKSSSFSSSSTWPSPTRESSSCVNNAKINSTLSNTEPNAVRAGPVVLYITGELSPVVLNPYFVPDNLLRQTPTPIPMRSLPATSLSSLVSDKGHNDNSNSKASNKGEEEIDLRLGLDAITQCTLFAELRPGGLLYHKLPSLQANKRFSSAREILKEYGMKCGLAESPLVPRPWTRMRYMFIDELQRGPKLTEFVGYNPREGSPWRFSQHNRYFRQGVWLDTIRRNEMNDGLHVHSSWQKSPQQSVPEISFLAPYP